jgi:hypothetical protein
MFRKFLERLRGSSRAPDDLALGTKRPGDFVDEPAVAPSKQARDDPGAEAMDAALAEKRATQT